MSATIENLSEYLVANSRTSLTDFIDSANNSGSSTNNIMNSPIFDSLDNSSDGSLNKHNSTTLSQPSLDQLPSNSNDIDHFDLGCDDISTINNHSEQTSNRINNQSSAYLQASSSSAAAATTSRLLSQPIRTQIPIFCQIEQFDTCPSVNYQPTLNDNDLFRTTDYKDSFKRPVSNTNPSNSTTSQGQPHLHQSKLALESVTNCNGSPSGLSGPMGSAPTNSADIDIKPNLDDLEGLNVNFDHLGSTSPLSLHQEPQLSPLRKQQQPQPQQIQQPQPQQHQQQLDLEKNHKDLQQISILSNSIGNNQDSFNQHLSSCKETYVLVPASTLWLDLVRTVLTQLGYSGLEIVNSKATLIIKNWKPISLDQVTDDKKSTVGEILSEIHSFVTLRIALVNNALSQAPTEWTETMIRQIVTTLCQSMSQLTLSKLCNISQPLISAIVRGGKRLGRRKCEEFGQWYLNYIKSMDNRPALAQPESTAARLVFDKTREIPQLKAWFADNTKPSEDILEYYSKILNEDRKFKPQVSAKALKNWWKNERQKLGIRQRENRGRPRLKRIE
jgi:hypothetical protein